jgi:octaprenyl-diphosphate synthase
MILAMQLIEKELEQVNLYISSIFSSELDILKTIAGQVLKSGGKRIRPKMLLLSTRLYGDIPIDAVGAASIIEVIHASSLLHDDVVDNNGIRRGTESLNSLINNKISVLLGDFLFTRAYARLSRFTDTRAQRAIADAVAHMSLGQFLEAYYEGDKATTIDEYIAIIERKTASLFASSSKVGAIIGKAPDEHIERLSEYGKNLGIAFQIIDDCLDLWGDEKNMGKPVGSDLAEKKYTLPVILLFQQASSGERQELDELLCPGELPPENIEKILKLMNKYEARTFSYKIAEEFGRKALEALEVTPFNQSRDALTELVHYTLRRDR